LVLEASAGLTIQERLVGVVMKERAPGEALLPSSNRNAPGVIGAFLKFGYKPEEYGRRIFFT